MIVNSVTKKELARSPRPDLDNELGTTGGTLSDLYLKNYKPKKKVTIKDFREMKDNDGTVRSLYEILRMPILANSWRVDTEDVENDAAVEQARFIEDQFKLPPHKGGMTTPFLLVIKRMLKSIIDGYQLFEKVFTLSPDGKIVLRKLAPRDSCSVTLLTDDKGGFAGYEQSYYSKEQRKIVKVTVPPEYCLLFTYNKDEDELYGQSAFQSAYYHFDRKRRLYYLYEQSVEKGAMPPKMLEVLEDNDDDESTKRSNLNAMTNFGVDSAVLVPTGYALKPYEAGKGRIDPMPGIDHHNAEIARSVLAQFILLGNQSGDTGSFALSKSHSDIFMMALRGVMNELEEHFNSYIIPQLIDYNFDTPYYPEFHYNNMTDDTREFIESVFTEIVKKSNTSLPQSFLDGLVAQVADRLDIDLDEDESLEQSEESTPGTFNSKTTSKTPHKSHSHKAVAKKKINSKTKYVNGQQQGWWRPLTPAEENISLSSIEDKMESQEDKFIREMKPVYKKVQEQAIADAQAIGADGDVTLLEGFTLKNASEYEQKITDLALDTYNAGKKITSDDLDIAIPATPKETKDYFKANAKSITEKQFNDLTFNVKTFLTSQLHKGQLSKDKHEFITAEFIAAELALLFDDFFESKIGLTGNILVSQSINRARDDIFQTAKEEIAVYQYSAILDESTCELCESIDGTVLEQAEYDATQYQPPLHQNCRCIWIAIKKDQSEIPEVTGIPFIDDEVVDKNQTL